MRKLTFADLGGRGAGPVVAGILPGYVIERGGFRVRDEPGFRTHQGEQGPHVHTVPEVFCIFAGCGAVEIDGTEVDTFETGDVLVIEPGEDHHLISRGPDPLVYSWMHLRPNRD